MLTNNARWYNPVLSHLVKYNRILQRDIGQILNLQKDTPFLILTGPWPLLLTWIYFNPSKQK